MNRTIFIIPTLSEWAQIGMAALLVGGGVWAMRKGRLKADG